ncbi:MAG: tetratricopeptide repeat protein [Planctomycetes bacterium]|nr:tetratricopeptide repeat protein [Planctomycetota bacterium]
MPSRPNVGGGGNINNRPNFGGGNTNINRPNVGGGNTNINRPTVGIGNRPAIGSNNTFNKTNNVAVNRPVNVNNRATQINRGINVNRPNGVYRPGYAHYHDYHGGWHHGYWNNYRPWVYGSVGLATGLLLGGTGSSATYANPYYDAAPADATPYYDYSQPIQVPEPEQVVDAAPEMSVDAPEAVPPAPAPEPPVDEKATAANKFLDDARTAFKANDYDKAQAAINQAIAQLPNDATLHEFNALIFFAKKQYREGAAAIYAVLAAGPGWDWDTMKDLYPDTKTYTDQLRALEEFCKANPMAASARFLLAYHYLVLGSTDAAAKVLKSVVTLQPDNELAAHILKSITQEDANRPVPGM